MPEQPLEILLVEDNPGDAELVRQMLLEGNVSFTLHRAASLVRGLDLLIEKPVDVVLLDLSLPDSNGLETFTAVHGRSPNVPIVVLTGMHDESLALRAVEAGAQDYLVKDGLDTRTLSKAVRYAVIRQTKTAEPATPEAAAELGTIIGVLGGKGGVGTTTVAAYLSIELRRLTNRPVLITDLDVYGGMIGFLMKTPSSYSVVDVTNNLHRLDETFWRSMVASGAGNVEVLPAQDVLGMEEPPNPAGARHVLHFVRAQYPWVVVDLGCLSSFSLDVVKEVSELCVVTTVELASLYKTKRVVQTLVNGGFQRGNAHLVVNRMPGWTSLTPAEVERVVDLSNHVVLPEIGREMEEASADGGWLGTHTNFRRRITALAESVMRVEKKKVRRPLLNLSLFGHSSK